MSNNVEDGSTKIMKYTDKNARGLLMNIIGHDIIHDYGPTIGDKRWSKVDEMISLFVFKEEAQPSVGGQRGGSDGDDSPYRSDSESETQNIPIPRTPERQRNQQEFTTPERGQQQTPSEPGSGQSGRSGQTDSDSETQNIPIPRTPERQRNQQEFTTPERGRQQPSSEPGSGQSGR